MRRPRAAPGAALAALLAGALPAASQHVAPPAAARGVVLPPAYFERLAHDPRAFTLPNGLFRAGADGRPLAAETSGTKQLVVIPALFSDSPAPHVSAGDIGQVLFDGPAPWGTLTEAYAEMSRGALTVTGRVLPWVRTGLTLGEVVGESHGIGDDGRVGEFLIQALELVDPDVDFGLYDNDGPDGLPNSGDDDHVVDAVAFEFIEVAASCGGPGIWPHLWGIAAQNDGVPYLTGDEGPDGVPIRVDAYIVQSAVDCDGVEVQSAGTIAHEFGHVLGLPDYYHSTAAGGAEGRRWVLGCWDLMAAGSWGCGPHQPLREPFGPTHFSARSKNALGWLAYRTVAEVRDQEIELEPVQASGTALRIPLDDAGREFLLVEYRTRTGFDRDLPADGILIYHQDFKGFLRPDPATGAPYFMSVVEQDGDRGLVRNTFEGGDRGGAGDAWGVDGAVQKLHARTEPALLRHDGTASTVTFHELGVAGGRAQVRLSTARAPELVPPAEPLTVTQVTGFERRIRIAGGAMPYVPDASVPEGVTVAADGDDLVLAGALTGAGPFELALRVTDARGQRSSQLFVPISAGEWVVGEDRLLQAFLETAAEPLTAGELRYLDFVGNGNGRYDVGDLRAWLRRQGALGAGG